jgi:hypothetical protein
VAKTDRSSTKPKLKMKLPTDLDETAIDPSLTGYAVELKTKILLTSGGASYTYFDQARAVRECVSSTACTRLDRFCAARTN